MVSQEARKGDVAERRRFAARVRRLLASMDITQDQLAAEFGLTRQSISGWVRAKQMPHDTTLAQFEALEARIVDTGQTSDVEAVYQEGANFLRTWLREYTTKALHAQAEAFGRNAEVDITTATQIAATATGDPHPADAQTPARRKRSG